MKKIIIYINIVYSIVFGIIFTFLPQEFLHYIDAFNPVYVIMIQFLGAFYFSFAMMNWFSRSSLLGGIYGRSIIIANFLYYLMTSFSLFKHTTEHTFFITLALLHTFLAISYYMILSSHPLPKRQEVPTKSQG